MHEVVSYLESKHIKYKVEGDEVIITCPNCGKEKLYINGGSKAYHCWVCEVKDPDNKWARGHLNNIKEEFGDLINITPINVKIAGAETKKFKSDLTNLVVSYHTALLSNKSAMKYLYSRGFTDETIVRCKLGLARKHNQNWISIPSFENGVPLLIKYRKAPPEENDTLPKCIREEGCKSILYNGDCINKFDDIIITEGEFDCITLLQHGFKNVVGMTGGAGTFKPEWYEQLLHTRKIYLVLDTDPVGQKAARTVWAERLGIGRCYNVVLPPNTDVNDFFQQHTADDFKKLIATAQRFKIDGVVSLKEAFYNMYSKSLNLETDEQFRLPWDSVNKLIGGGLERKRLMVVGGIPGVGKCVKWDSKIVDTNSGGLVNIEDFVGSKLQTVLSVKDSRIHSAGVYKHVDSGEQECYKVTTALGNFIECPSHNKFLTLSGWVSLSNLRVGNKIALPKIIDKFGDEYLDVDIGRLLGYIISKGCTACETRTASFSSSDYDMVEDYRRICNKYGSDLKIVSY